MKTFEEHYLKKDYPNALLILQKNETVLDSGLWNYNMGTVYAEMQNYPMARFHFLMAEMKGFDGKSLGQNQSFVNEQLEVAKLEKPLDTSDYLIKAGLFSTQGPLTTVSLVLLVVGLFSLKKKPTFKNAVLFVFVVSLPVMLNFWISSWPRKIVTATKTIYDGPSALFAAKGELPAGLMILTNTKGDWEEIIFPARYSGWIKSDDLKALEK